MEKEIAIIDNNSLARLGLENLLEEIVPNISIRTFGSYAELMSDTPDMFVHYFVSIQIYLEHTTFFLRKKNRTVVLCNEETQAQLLAFHDGRQSVAFGEGKRAIQANVHRRLV